MLTSVWLQSRRDSFESDWQLKENRQTMARQRPLPPRKKDKGLGSRGKPLLLISAFLGFVGVFTTWRNGRVIRLVQPVDVRFAWEGGIADNSQQAASPNISDEVSPQNPKNESGLDLVLWTDSVPLSRAAGNFVVTRTTPAGNVRGFEEVLNVEFRLCNVTSCRGKPNESQLPPKVVTELKYILNQRASLTLYSVDRQQKRYDPQQFKAVTYWSDQYQQHVPLKYDKNMRFQTCPRGDCPKPCPQNSLLEGYHRVRYPYKWDREDRLCKSTLPDDLPPLRPYGGICRCESTCFTPEVNAVNTTWPWASQEEKLEFYSDDAQAKEQMGKVRRRCQAKRGRGEGESYDRRFVCKNGTLPCAAHGDFQHHLFFIPKAKLIFCGIPKVGVTEWAKFFRHVMGAKDYLSLPHYKEDRKEFLMSSLGMGKAMELLNDPTWTKAVFFRNPAERLLSAYLDRVVSKSYTQKVFKIGSDQVPKEQRKVLTFAEFVELVTNKTATSCADPKGLKSCTDPHWKPQVMTCGLDHLLNKFDFIGSFDHIANHTQLLLERVGIWNDYGKSFDDGMGMKHARSSHMCKVPPPIRDDDEIVWGFNQRGPSGRGGSIHATDSIQKKDKYYTPELLAKVREAYALDFSVWDDISRRRVVDVATGRDLSIVKEFCSSHVAPNYKNELGDNR